MKTVGKMVLGYIAVMVLLMAACLGHSVAHYRKLRPAAERLIEGLDTTVVRVLDIEVPRRMWDDVAECPFRTGDLKRMLYLEGGLAETYLKGDTLYLRNHDDEYRYYTFNIYANIGVLQPELELLVLHDGDETGYFYCNDKPESTSDNGTVGPGI